MRPKGECTPKRTAEFCGVPYDPSLVSASDLRQFTEKSLYSQEAGDPLDRILRLIRHTERIRSDANWPHQMRGILRHAESKPPRKRRYLR